MKKYMAIVASISMAFLYGMEQGKKKRDTVSFLIDQTVVKLSNCRIHKVGAVDLMVAGKIQQQTLKIRPNALDSHEVGLIEDGDSKNYNWMVYVKDKGVDSGSDDEMYKPYDVLQLADQKLWENSHPEIIKSRVITVLEPRITKRHYFDKQQGKFVDGPHYYAHRKALGGKDEYLNVEADGDKAIEEALSDLIVCNQQALHGGWEIIEGMGKKENKSIALSAFGIDVGVPVEKAAPITVGTILDFIKKNPKKFALIHLFLKRPSDFDHYKKWFESAVEQK